MRQTTVTVRNRAGLHTRPAALLVKLTAKYKSDIWLEKDGFEINAKSIIGVMTLAAEQGSQLVLRADGHDEDEAVEAIASFFQEAFGEPIAE
jgi:phosphocarrier protein